ncbi:MAG: flavin reductase family protein [Bacteroidota bacterium]
MSAYLSLDPMDLPIPKRHAYLLTAVAPRPIAFASTIDKEGRVNLSPFSFFNVFSSNPPVMIFSPAKSGLTGKQKDSYLNVKEVPEVVINIVNHPIVEQMSLSSTGYERGVNEFVKSGLTELASDLVKPPRVAEAPVAFECRVDQVIELGEEGASGNLVICRVLKMHFREEYLDADQKLDTEKLDLVGRMGGSWYTRSSGSSLFEIPKPIRKKGIGIDQLPASIRHSEILSGNNLGRLGNVEKLPNEAEITEVGQEQALLKLKQRFVGKDLGTALHKLAKQELEKGNTDKALKILLQKY